MKLQHDTDSAFCWCKPTLQRTCPQCRGNGRQSGSWAAECCWRCNGVGFVGAGPEDSGLLVIHRRVEEETQGGCGVSLIALLVFALLIAAVAVGVYVDREVKIERRATR